jgi:YesN/AraC family two-component response regulator
VDDDPETLAAVSDWLGRDFACTCCSTVAQAMDAIQRGTFHLAIVDNRLPDGRGLDVLRALRDHSHHVPIILMTGFGDYALACEAIEAGASHLLEKPFSRRKIQTVAYAALTGARPAGDPAGADQRLARVLQYVREHMPTDLREQRLLRELGFSRTAFHQFFVASVGQTFRDYVAEERLKLARYLLASTALGPAQIADRVGLRSASYFSAWFRKLDGQTPLGYRRSVRTANAAGEEGP